MVRQSLCRYHDVVKARPLLQIATVAACLAVFDVEAQVEPSRLDLYATLASDYLHRGMSQTDGGAALQLGIDYRHRTGFFAGAWASNVDYETERLRQKPRSREIDYYIGIDERRGRWSWTAALAHYTYPDVGFDYDYTEFSVGASFKDRVSYRAAYADDLLSVGYRSLDQEISVNFPLPTNMELGIVLGRFSSSDRLDIDFTHYNVGLSKLIGAFTMDLRYYDTDYAIVTPLGRPADHRWVLSFSYGFDAI